MEPIRRIEYAMRFASGLSPWWLLPAVPVVVLLTVWIYRRQTRQIATGHAWGLTALRALVLALAVFLAFRPSLIRRDIATFPGRLLLVLDDSASMAVHDPELPEEEALRIARAATPLLDTQASPLTDLRETLIRIEQSLIRFERFGRGADREHDAFWREADRVQQWVQSEMATLAERATDLADTDDPADPLHAAIQSADAFPALMHPLFQGQNPPDPQATQRIFVSLDALIEQITAARTRADRAEANADAGGRAPDNLIERIRRSARLDLALGWLERALPRMEDAAQDMSLRIHMLSQPDPQPQHQIPQPVVSEKETDIASALIRHIEEEHPFPLAGIVLISDGQHLGERTLAHITRAAARRSVPIMTAGIGGLTEPPDLAVLQIDHAPMAIAGRSFGIRPSLKVIAPGTDPIPLELRDAQGETLTTDTLAQRGRQIPHRLAFDPDEPGLKRLTVAIGPIEGEVVPEANNQMDLVFRVREAPPRILFLDWKPRWQSRFVLNVLNRLGALDLNAIIGLTQPDGQLQRGSGRGRWPEDAAGLSLYEVVILGQLPAGLLTAAEWDQLADYVQSGGTLILLGDGRQDPLPLDLRETLLPTLSRDQAGPRPPSTVPLELTPTGRWHPVTRSLYGAARLSRDTTTDRRREDSLVLLQTSEEHLMVAARFVDAGKVLLVDTDRLWRRLNAGHLEAHATLVEGILDWAIEARPPDAGPEPDLHRYTTRDALQVWTPSRENTQPIEMHQGEQTVTAMPTPVHPGAAFSTALFPGLAPGTWALPVTDPAEAQDPIHVVDRRRELHNLAQNRPWLESLAQDAGGTYRPFTEADRLIARFPPRSREERRERIWRLWDAPWVLALLISMLCLEWVWRKLAGMA